MINEFACFKPTESTVVPLVELIAESAWTTERWDVLSGSLAKLPPDHDPDFDTGVGKILLMLRADDKEQSSMLLSRLRGNVVRQLSATNIKSLQSCHDIMLRLQILSEMEEVADHTRGAQRRPVSTLVKVLRQRADSLGTFPTQQQKLLSIQRAILNVTK